MGTRKGHSLSGTPPFGQEAKGVAFSVQDPSDRHSISLELTARELAPTDGASEAMLGRPLRSSKCSAVWRFLARTPTATGGTQLKQASAELSGLLGDVSLARGEALWSWERPFPRSGAGPLSGAFLGFSAALGVAVPLGVEATTPLEDRFHLGGANRGLSERLPGFSAKAIGPSGTTGQSGVEPNTV